VSRWPSTVGARRVYHQPGRGGTGSAVFSVNSIRAPRPAVDWFSTADGVERTPGDPTLPADKVSISPEARSQLTQAGAGGRAAEAAAGKSGRLTTEQQRQVQELQQRDAHVRSHEAAHQAAGGDLTGPASFSYQLGPDGRSYAVGGEVPIQSRSGRTPDETISIARRVRAAALAPSDPSAADLADRKSTRLNSSHSAKSRMPSSA